MTVLPVLPVPLLIVLGVALLAFCGWRWWAERAARASGGRARSWLWRAGLVVLVVAAAFRPGIPGGSSSPAASSELDVFFLVDTTASVVAEDYDGDRPRLDGIRADAGKIVDKLPGARFSLITFDSSAVTRLPLTGDATAVTTALEVLRPEVTTYSRGSSVTAAAPLLTESLERARSAHPERARAVFYFGDGEQTDGQTPPAFSVPAGAVNGGAVLGYGTGDGGRMRENEGYVTGAGGDYIQDRSQNPPVDARSVIDENELRAIADQLHVPYAHRSAGDPIEAALTSTDPGRLAADVGAVAGRTELYWILALGAVALVGRELYLIGADLLSLSPRRRRRGGGVGGSGGGTRGTGAGAAGAAGASGASGVAPRGAGPAGGHAGSAPGRSGPVANRPADRPVDRRENADANRPG